MNDTFDFLYSIAQPIEFNTNWCAEKRSFNNAVIGVDAPFLHAGQMVNSKDNHGRKLVMIGTACVDNVILYQRFVNSPKGVICSNETFDFSELVKTTTHIEITNNINDDQVKAICITIFKYLSSKKSIVKQVQDFLQIKARA